MFFVQSAGLLPSLHDHMVAITFRGEIARPKQLEHGAGELPGRSAGNAPQFAFAFFISVNQAQIFHGDSAPPPVESKKKTSRQARQCPQHCQRHERNEARGNPEPGKL